MSDATRGRWIFSAWKNIRLFQAGEYTARFHATQNAGRAADFLARLRKVEVVSGTAAIDAIALTAGIARQELRNTILPVLEKVRAVTCERDFDEEPIALYEFSLTEDDVAATTARVWEAFDPDATERAAILALENASLMPLTEAEMLERLEREGLSPQQAVHGVELADSFSLVQQKHLGDFGQTFIYNEYLWGQQLEHIARVLGALPSAPKEALRSLMEEVQKNQGTPIVSIQSADQRTVEQAARIGLLDATAVRTKDGREQSFLFTPHFYGYAIQGSLADTLDHRKLVIASFTYGSKFSLKYRLHDPVRFLEVLVRNGTAGKANPIGTDYPLMEKQGIVRVEKIAGDQYGRFRFRTLKHDVLREALDVMKHGNLLLPSAGNQEDVSGLWVPRSFRDPETERARLARAPKAAKDLDETLLSAIRDAAHGVKRR